MGAVFRFAIGAVAVLVLSSCSAISTVATWLSPEAPTRRYGKVMVASLAPDPETRRLYEDVVAGELVKHGISSFASYRAVQSKGTPSRQALLETAKRNNFDAVLTIQTTQLERHTDVEPGSLPGFPDYYYTPPRFAPEWGWYQEGYGGGYGYGYYGGYGGYGPWGGASWYPPPSVVTYDVATIQINLLNARDSKLVWAATMETLEPERAVKVAKDLAEAVTKSLGKEGIL